MAWETIMVPVDRGFLVQVTDGAVRSTVARVAWDRRGSKHPFRTFKAQLRDALTRAAQEAELLDTGAPPEIVEAAVDEGANRPKGGAVVAISIDGDSFNHLIAACEADGVEPPIFVARLLADALDARE